jgi:hypothetical protein
MTMNYTVKIYKNEQKVQMIRTHKIRVFLKKIRFLKFTDEGINVYLKVSYGKQFDKEGKYTDFYNDGLYDNPDDFWWAFNAFIEK